MVLITVPVENQQAKDVFTNLKPCKGSFSTATRPRGGMSGQCPPAQRSCPPVTLNLDHLESCYCFFYVNDYRLKLPNDVAKGHSPAL